MQLNAIAACLPRASERDGWVICFRVLGLTYDLRQDACSGQGVRDLSPVTVSSQAQMASESSGMWTEPCAGIRPEERRRPT